LCKCWETSACGDFLLFGQAIKEDWPVPPKRRRPLMAAEFSPLFRQGTPARLLIALGRLAVAAYSHDLDQEQAEREGTAHQCNTRRAATASRERGSEQGQAVSVIRSALSTPARGRPT
jgi:hypothetical protein